jgi:hypothetical protein
VSWELGLIDKRKDKNMTLELGTRKILLSAGLRDTCGMINEALAKGAVDAVIWIRDLHGAVDECEALSKLGLRVAPAEAAAMPHRSLWRETMGY